MKHRLTNDVPGIFRSGFLWLTLGALNGDGCLTPSNDEADNAAASLSIHVYA